MNRKIRFTLDGEFVARRAFTLDGVNIAAGDKIDRSNMADSMIEKLFNNRMIMPVSAAQTDQSAPVAPAGNANSADGSQQTEETDADAGGDASAQGSEETGATDETEITKGAPVRAEHRGFGKYYLIDAAGNVVEGPLSKDEALAKVPG